MRLVALGGPPDATGPHTVLVLDGEGAPIGLLADEILDVVQGEAEAGLAVLAGRATAIVDAVQMLRAA